MTTTKQITLDDLIAALNLRSYCQDWALMAADAKRVQELASYYLYHGVQLTDDARDELGELVLASADALFKSAEAESQQAAIRAIEQMLRQGKPFDRMILTYWCDYWAGDPSSEPLFRLAAAF